MQRRIISRLVLCLVLLSASLLGLSITHAEGIDVVVPSVRADSGRAPDPGKPPVDQTVPPRPISIKVEGTVEAVSDTIPGLLVVNQTSFLLTTETLVRPPDVPIRVGDLVLVYATITGEEPAVATSVRVFGSDVTSSNPIEFRGSITEVPPAPYLGRWVVAGREVLYTATKVPAGPPPQLGYYAQIKGYVQANQTIQATEVTVFAPSDVTASFEFAGEITLVGPVPGEWIIGGVTGWIEQASQIVGLAEVGGMAQVSGRHLADGQLVFRQVRIISAEQRELRIRGLIAARDVAEGFGHWVVGGQVVEVDELTFVDESRCRAAVGQWAEVTALMRGRYPYALRIRVERPE
jgi:hypothetical protein